MVSFNRVELKRLDEDWPVVGVPAELWLRVSTVRVAKVKLDGDIEGDDEENDEATAGGWWTEDGES